MKHTKHYLCGTDYRYEMSLGMADFYNTIDDFYNNNQCWKECGIVEIELNEAGEEVGHHWVVKEDLYK